MYSTSSGRRPFLRRRGIPRHEVFNRYRVDVSCTFVDGVVAEVGVPNTPTYYPQTATLAPGVLTPMLWDATDLGVASFSPYENFSCNLPPGVEMNVVGYDYTDAP